MNLEELKSRLEEGFHADEKELYADIFNPSLVSKLLELFECAQRIKVRLAIRMEYRLQSRRANPYLPACWRVC